MTPTATGNRGLAPAPDERAVNTKVAETRTSATTDQRRRVTGSAPNPEHQRLQSFCCPDELGAAPNCKG